MRFAIEKRRPAGPSCRLSTAQPVNEPFLDMLIELHWPTGRLVREYTFLLDPPEYKEPRRQRPPPCRAAPVAKPAPRRSRPRAATGCCRAAPTSARARAAPRLRQLPNRAASSTK